MDQKRLSLPIDELRERARAVKLLAMDVDGVLTGGEIILLESGEEIKFFNSKDRLVIAVLRDLKDPLRIAWITGRSSKAVTAAAADLGVGDLVMKSHNKRQALELILAKHKIGLDEAAFIGDDLIDLPAMRAARFAACPSDAVPDILSCAHYISPIIGGRGAVRDVIEFILKAQGRWDAVVSSFLR